MRGVVYITFLLLLVAEALSSGIWHPENNKIVRSNEEETPKRDIFRYTVTQKHDLQWNDQLMDKNSEKYLELKTSIEAAMKDLLDSSRFDYNIQRFQKTDDDKVKSTVMVKYLDAYDEQSRIHKRSHFELSRQRRFSFADITSFLASLPGVQDVSVSSLGHLTDPCEDSVSGRECTVDNSQCGDTGTGECKCANGYTIILPEKTKCYEEKALGEICEENQQCVGSNQECKTVCVCKAGLFSATNKAGEEGCYEARSSLTEQCTIPQQCADITHATCIGDSCGCGPGYTRVGVTNNCIGNLILGSSCKENSQCSTQHSECSHEKKCSCSPGYLRSGAECLSLLGSSCSTTAQCAPIDSKCSNGTCTCVSGTEPTGITTCQTCPTGRNGDSCNEYCPCSSGMECVEGTCVPACDAGDEGNSCSDRCPCLSQFNCVDGICEADCDDGDVGDSCSDRCPCSSQFYCVNDVCQAGCDAGNVGDSCSSHCLCLDPFSCVDGLCKAALMNSCNQSAHCNVDNSECVNGTCKCSSGYFPNGNTNCTGCDAGDVGDTCSSHCPCFDQFSCVDGVCKADLMEQCKDSAHCIVDNSECVNGTCKCSSGYFPDGNATCTECSAGSVGSSCNNYCDCSPSFQCVNDVCVSVLGGRCSDNSHCNVGNSLCDNFRCACSSGHYPVGDNNCTACPTSTIGGFCRSECPCTSDDNAFCNAGDSTCHCFNTYVAFNSSCLLRKSHSEECEEDVQCPTNSECAENSDDVTETCECINGFAFVTGDGCQEEVDIGDPCEFQEVCPPLSECKVNCTCPDSMSASILYTRKCVSDYQSVRTDLEFAYPYDADMANKNSAAYATAVATFKGVFSTLPNYHDSLDYSFAPIAGSSAKTMVSVTLVLQNPESSYIASLTGEFRTRKHWYPQVKQPSKRNEGHSAEEEKDRERKEMEEELRTEIKECGLPVSKVHVYGVATYKR